MDMLASAYKAASRDRAVRERHPLHCLFEITPACNLRCHFCYVALDPYKGPYLSTEQMYAALDRIERAGTLWLTLTGGEIFSRRDFPEIYAYAKQKGFLVTLYTNATLVTERIARMLAANPPHEIEVSIYGADAEHYEATTGIPGSFARFERGIQHLLDAGFRPLLKHTTSSLTQNHVAAVRAWCEARGVRHRFSTEIENRHSGGKEPSVYRIQPRKVVQLQGYFHEARTGKRLEGPLPDCAIGLPEGETDDRLYRCSAGRSGFFVDALGNASHCVLDREPAFPLLSMEWEELWAAMGAWVEQPLPADAPCSGCSLRGGCSNCPARSRLATGSPFLKDTYHCDVTHAAHGLPPAQHPNYVLERRPLAACAS
jgi:MoaA/NifB/PqqE/SkfB family radical SAM enzyme